MNEETFNVHPSDQRPQRFRAVRLGTLQGEQKDAAEPTRRRIDVYGRPNERYFVEINNFNLLTDRQTTELRKDLDQWQVVELAGWSKEAVAFYAQQGWDVAEDNDKADEGHANGNGHG